MSDDTVVYGLLGKKLGMTQVFGPGGKREPVTVINAGPCTVLEVRTKEKNGYSALQLGFDAKRKKSATKAELGHAAKAKADPKRFVREFRFEADVPMELGAQVTLAGIFEEGSLVDVTGTSKGMGFQGPMKRWGMHGQPASHGTERKHRSPGSLGRGHSTAKGVIKGKRMGGHMGARKRTIRGLKVIKVEADKGLLLVRGGIPGPTGGYVIVRRSNLK